MPNSLNDMKQYCKQSNYNILNEIIGQMETSNLNLYLPIFRHECTSRAEKALGKVKLIILLKCKSDLIFENKSSLALQLYLHRKLT